MSTISRIRSLGLLTLSLSMLGSVSCGGSGTNNDQGTSFLALGYFADTSGDTGETGAIIPLFADSATQTPLGIADGNIRITYLGLQNRLTNQFIRVVRVDCTYDVPGSTLLVPNDSFNIGTVIGPAPTVGTPADPVLGNVAYAGFEVLSPDVISYLNNNQNSLPQLPFRMSATCDATGVTQAGDTITTNGLTYQLQFVDISENSTGSNDEVNGDGGGFQTGPGSGGDIATFGGSEDTGTGGALTSGNATTGADDTQNDTVTDDSETTTNP